jgi:thioredoxin 1
VNDATWWEYALQALGVHDEHGCEWLTFHGIMQLGAEEEMMETLYALPWEEAGLVVVDFWAEWCGPCKILTPVLEKVIDEEKVVLAKVNVDEEPDIAMRFGVQSVPSVIAFLDGEELDRFVGVHSEADIRAWVRRMEDADGTS